MKSKRSQAMATTIPALSARFVVTIHVDSKGEVQRVDPDRFVISKSKQEEVIWQASDREAYFTVDFGEQSPFEYTQFSSDNPVSGLVRREVLADPGKYYKYTVRAGGKTIDPGGVVDR
jgi:hypothetical protein